MSDLTDIFGISVGHWTDREAATGCSVVLCPDGAVAGVDVRGAAPGTRETDLLDPVCLMPQAHGVVLSGGSAYGLGAADGVMRWLEERDHGFTAGPALVPIVPAAVLFDLPLGRSDVRPDADAGYAACENASDGPVEQGNVGAGTGAAAGKLLGIERATKSGLGSAGRRLDSGLIVAALVAANPFGDIVDPDSGEILAGARSEDGTFADSLQLAQRQGRMKHEWAGANTTLAVVATNASLTKSEATAVARMAHDGMARAVRPAHTLFDGDIVFCLALGDEEADVSLIGTLAAEVLADAIVSGVEAAASLAGLPSARQLRQSPRESS